MLPMKRSGYSDTQRAAWSLQRWHSFKSVVASAQEVPCSTELALTTERSMPRASMSCKIACGSNILPIKACAPGRGALAGVAPKPVNTVRLVEASNTSCSNMCT